MEASELPERVTRLEERMATKDDFSDLKDQIAAVERDLKEEIVGVKSDLKDLDHKMDVGFVELKNMIRGNTKLIEDNAELIKTSMLAAENKLLKKIVGWVIPALIFVIPAMVGLFNRFLAAPSP